MFGDCGLRFPFLRRCIGTCRRREAAADLDPDLDPVVLVTGMGGSILNARNRKSGSIIRVWVRLLLANFEFKKYLWSLYNPDTGLPPPSPCLFLILASLGPFIAFWYQGTESCFAPHLFDRWSRVCFCGFDLLEFKNHVILIGIWLGLAGYTESLNVDDEIVVPEDDYGLQAIDILDPSLVILALVCIPLDNNFCSSSNIFSTGAPGCIYDSLLTGLQFVYGFESFFFVSRWTMHQLVIP
ncbi:hypothetical protein GW17_00025508 [Ensete ventricosum]|nr:hypothetical protein GW17_00025508 [Ensete ventricosum]